MAVEAATTTGVSTLTICSVCSEGLFVQIEAEEIILYRLDMEWGHREGQRVVRVRSDLTFAVLVARQERVR